MLTKEDLQAIAGLLVPIETRIGNLESRFDKLESRFEILETRVDNFESETKSRFAWIGEIENERLLAALESLSENDLKLLTLYVYEGYTESEISKVFSISQPAIHKRIEKITMFLKKF